MYPQKFLDLLLRDPSPEFIISTHQFCDGDGLGAGLALYHGLKKLNKKVSFYTLEKHHPKYNFMNQDDVIQVFDTSQASMLKNKVIIFVDVNDYSIAEPLYSLAKKQNCLVYFIDHHILNNQNKTDQFFIDNQASSTAELIYDLIQKLHIPLDVKIASNLFCSIVFDTSSFRHIKNSPRPFLIASKLIPYIPDTNLIYEQLFKTLTVQKLQFMSKLNLVEYYFKDQVAYLHIKEQEFKDYNTDFTQAYDLMDIVNNVASIQTSILIIEKDNGQLKLSLRSKQLNLIPLIQSFGGGGHHHSAGATIINSTVAKTKSKLIDILNKEYAN